MQKLEGRVALVTGSAGGIGRAIADRLAREGAQVWIGDLDAAAAERAAAEIVAGGAKATAAALDVTKSQDVGATLGRIAADHGRLDILVNNAGLNVRSDFRHLGEADWARIREVNLDGVVRLAREGFALLKASGRGAIINVSSIMSTRHLRQLAAYSATKGAVTALTRALAVEYAPFAIRVNSVAPGFVETGLTERFLRNPAIKKALLDRTLLRRFGTGADMAGAVAFLASDDAAYITGAELVVDGGMSIGL
ncbi:MAG TPA: SDR family NAD(P)-dependent oxidoreductase [Hyphomicrobiaceae bacterium]|nr:SDR family NAD(P)-dependent oxidoreductase [Hyphomicrobiaceae bacterium]